jgi:DNA replication protein DnaC
MTAFLKIDRCQKCGQEHPWEWVPEIVVSGKPLTGTGVWRSRLLDGVCPRCVEAAAIRANAERRSEEQRAVLIGLLGGVKPYREFTFERYTIDSANERALQKARSFDAIADNLYLWGRRGVGKTHLAYAIARHAYLAGRSAAIVTPAQLIRRLRMKSPDEEQHGIDFFVNVQVLVLDDVGVGSDSAYARQVLQEILDGRDFRDRAGLVVTSRYSPPALTNRLSDDTITSRLAGMCDVVEIRGSDRRLRRSEDPQSSGGGPNYRSARIAPTLDNRRSLERCRSNSLSQPTVGSTRHDAPFESSSPSVSPKGTLTN